ncbi:MAG TPA: hypothetical protein VND45_04315 [Thermoanaerobaculia bacterium]|nr:hypothetical protein [Thermoanaerobaculia bacterium]
MVIVPLKGESEGGIYKSTRDVDHVVPMAYRDRVVVIRPRHRLPFGFTERRWDKLAQLMTLGDLRTREVLSRRIASGDGADPRRRRFA